MLYRKIEHIIEEHFQSKQDRILIVEGARQIGKSFTIRQIGKKLFQNYVEINMEEDKLSLQQFADAKNINDFYLALSTVAGKKLGNKNNTLIFIDEIQAYDHLFTLLKFLRQDDKFTYVASGSLLGIALKNTSSIPIGSIRLLKMYPLDFEEFLIANGIGDFVIKTMEESFLSQKSLNNSLHETIMNLFRKYLIIGGMPAAVDNFVKNQNIAYVRDIQNSIYRLYSADASKYEFDNNQRLKIRRIYDMIPSNLENKKKRVVAKDIEQKTWKRMENYQDEFEFLISSGITLEVQAISNPKFPLIESMSKKLLKLYHNDVGILSGIFYKNNIKSILSDQNSINLGSVYEVVVAQELKAHGYKLFYYDNKKNGEVDFLIDDYENQTVLPLEVKSGKDYKIHSALNNFLTIKDYNIHKAYLLSNEQKVYSENGITYIPIYYIMFFKA